MGESIQDFVLALVKYSNKPHYYQISRFLLYFCINKRIMDHHYQTFALGLI